MHVKHHTRAIERRRLNHNAEPLGLAAEFRQFIGVGQIERHRGGQKFHRIIGLEICGLIGNQGIGRRMAFVEAVIGKFREEIENLVRRRALKPLFQSTRHKAFALGIHFRFDLFTHGPAQQIRFPQRIARKQLGDLHHLLLIDDHPMGFFQDRFEHGMEIFDLFLSEFARAINRNIRHGAGPVKCHKRDDIFKAVSPHFGQRFAHARTFKLEHADRFTTAQHFIGFDIINRDGRNIERYMPLLQQFDGCLDHGQGFETQKVEFDQTRRFHPFHVELGDRHIGFRIAIERDNLFQRPVTDHDPRRMGGGMAMQPFEIASDIEHARDRRILFRRHPQARLALDCLFKGDGIGRILRNQFGELIHLPIRQLQNTPDIAHDTARLQGAEGDDLRDTIMAIAILHITDHLVAPLLTEIDIEVGHGHAFGIEKAFEQQAKA